MTDDSDQGARDEITGDPPRQVVRSPEQVALHLPIAGPTARMLAYAIDYVVIGAALVGAVVLILLTTRLAGTLLPYLRELPRVGERTTSSFVFLLIVIGLLLQL